MTWNLASFVIMGTSGVCLNILIGFYYELTDLGVFNQTYALYIFVSQLAAAGIPVSTLKYVAEFSSDPGESQSIIFSALFAVGIAAAAVSYCFWLLRYNIGSLLSSPGVVDAVTWISPGLFFFCINKVCLSAFNGFRQMRIFAVLRSLRYVLIIGSFFVLTLLACPGTILSLVFTLSEFVLFLVSAFVMTRRNFSIRYTLRPSKYWMTRHLRFGMKSFVSHMLLELNTRVDILMLGLFFSDTAVGVYSFVAILAEGFYQLLAVSFILVTPLLVRMLSSKEYQAVSAMIIRGKRITYMTVIPAGVLLTSTFPLWIRLITNRPELHAAWPIFTIIVAGTVCASGYIPFRNILLAAGLPGWHTFMILIVVTVNAVFNLMLIPLFESIGAAMATSLSMLSVMICLFYFTGKKLPSVQKSFRPFNR